MSRTALSIPTATAATDAEQPDAEQPDVEQTDAAEYRWTSATIADATTRPTRRPPAGDAPV